VLRHDDVYTFVQCVTLGVLVYGILSSPLLNLIRRRAKHGTDDHTHFSALFYVTFLCFLVFVVVPWLYYQLRCNPLLW
jgi:hypothetical protein